MTLNAETGSALLIEAARYDRGQLAPLLLKFTKEVIQWVQDTLRKYEHYDMDDIVQDIWITAYNEVHKFPD